MENQIVTQYNPFRYRGYYYDKDLGWYYLQTRYYNPQWGRFVNADSYVSTGQGLLGYNMFAYCNNNSIMNIDATGNFGKKIGAWFEEKTDNLITFLTDPTGKLRELHYSRNKLSINISEETLINNQHEKEDEANDKFHQNNKKEGRNRKYVIGEWFSFEIVYYSDGTINNTPEDRGTFNVYSGDHWFGKYVIHGYFDVMPYMLWGNEENDSTSIWDRLGMMFQ